MAMMEKPRQKKKKKNVEIREIAPPPTSLDGIDIDFPTTSIRDAIPSYDCFVASSQTTEDSSVEKSENYDEQIADALRDIDEKQPDITEQPSAPVIEETIQEEMASPIQTMTIEAPMAAVASETSNIEPTAPLVETTLPKLQIVDYPNLESMKKMATQFQAIKLTPKLKPNEILKPFTREKMAEFYDNPCLPAAKLFENEFVDAELNSNFKDHILYEMMMKYSKSRYNLKLNMIDLQNFKKNYSQNAKSIWTIEKRDKKYSGQCQDNNWVNGTESYDFALVNEKTFDKVSSSLTDLVNLISFNYTLNVYATNVYKIQIEQFIHELLTCSPELMEIETESPIRLNTDINPNLLEPIQNIRTAISILFSFVRGPLPDKTFYTDLKTWLQKLVAIQLRLATWKDHLFLLLNILRCPGGIASWATSMIQIPFDNFAYESTIFAAEEIHYLIIFMRSLLLPVRARKEFLIKLHDDDNRPINQVKEDIWIMIDSDGEEEDKDADGGQCLKENDLVALLNQVPLKKIFSAMMFVKCDNDNGSIQEDSINSYHLLKFIAFSTDFIGLLGEGLKTYGTERYKQFAKILCRLIRHVVLYVSNIHKIFQTNNTTKDQSLCSRIQIEHDTFILRACSFIYKSRNLGTWQYLAIVPFADLYLENLWKLYYCLSIGFADDAVENIEQDFKLKTYEENFMDEFNDTVVDLPAEDMYYLLQTFSSMILSRSPDDWDFIERITLDLFMIGFINKTTKDSCYKIIKELLENITTKYPTLISALLNLLKEKFQLNDTDGIYLFKLLPIEQWQPKMADFEVIAAWLLNFGYETPENTLARTIFGRLNWNFNSNNELFLPHDIHIRTACLIVQVYIKHVPETLGTAGISESVRQVSMLAKTQTPKQQFTIWCWSMISILRLHCLDQNREFVIRTLRNPSESFGFIPELERINQIFDGVSDSRPLALYASILCSMWGHSVPQICHKGFQQLLLLLTDYRHAIVIRCLHLIVPLFLECPESLSKCDKFQQIVSQILTADQTYLKMAKDLINTDRPGPVVELFGNMIQTQLIDFYGYGLASPLPFVNLWLQCLTQNGNWSKDPNCLYLIDLILCVSYQFPETWYAAKEYFRFIYMRVDDTKSMRATFLPFLNNNRHGPFPQPTKNILWLSLLILELEYEITEVQTHFWAELLKQLQNASGKFSMDNVIKKAAQLTNCTNYSTNTLTIFKLINLILTCTFEHPLLPIVCQKFFQLFLARIPMSTDEQRVADTFGVADKFYESNISLMKRLKKFLNDAEKWHKDTSLQAADEELSSLHNCCSMLFRSYSLWLEETRLNKIYSTQIQMDFPPQYNVPKLVAIFTGNEAYWNEFICFNIIRKAQKSAANEWLKDCFRLSSTEKSLALKNRTTNEISALEDILKHLKSYDTPIPPINVTTNHSDIENFSYSNLSRKVLPILKKKFQIIDESSRQFDMNINELKCLDCNYKELVRVLYRNEKLYCNRSVQCSSLLNNCRGSSSVQFTITQPIINDTAKNKMNNNRERHEKLINKLTSGPSQNTVMAIVEIQHYVRQILLAYQSLKMKKDTSTCKSITDVGIQFFYKTIGGLNEYISVFPPANELCAQTLSSLGILIQENQSTEGINLLQTAIRRPDLVKLISDLFVPSTTAPQFFISMYTFIIDSHMNRCDSKILFVLLSKFDIATWLIDFKPKLSEISQLIKLIVQGLACWNQSDTVLIQGVLRRHLVNIFEYDFPEHYGEVLQIVIDGCSDQSLMACVLMDLINSIYKLANCHELDVQTQGSKAKDEMIYFATTQKLLSFKVIQDTMALLARHFQNERLQHGLHGLYPKHKNYCDTILLLYKSLGYAAVVAAVHVYPGTLADNLVELIWPSFCDMFSPWLVPYYPQSTHQVSANWIKQVMSNSQILLPWSELHIENAQKLFFSFVDCIQFMLDTLPTNTTILSNIFYWYEIHFGNLAVPRYILTPIHGALTLLPWNRFRPTPIHLGCMYRILQQFIPECHSFVGFIFLRCNWTLWLQTNMSTWDFVSRHKVLSSLLQIFIKLAFEPHVRENVHFVGMINEAATYPWHLLDYQGIEGVFEWFCTSSEPSIVLQLQMENEAVDSGVLNLLRVVSTIVLAPEANASQSQIQSKRILYVRTIVRMLRLCGSKHQQLLETKEGLSSFHSAVTDLISVIENITVTQENRLEIETTNLLIELVCGLQTQSEYVSRIFAEAIIIWQSKSCIDTVINRCLLNAIGSCKLMSNSLIVLVEATIFNYFRNTDPKKSKSTWKDIINRLNERLTDSNVKDLLQGKHLLALHIHILCKLKKLTNPTEKIDFLDKIYKQLANFKTNENTEPKLAIIWSLTILCSYKYLKDNPCAEQLLKTLAYHFQELSNHADGWGDGLLKAIGLNKDGVTKKRRILTRCLTCIIFSLLRETNSQYSAALEDLMQTVNSKKFADIRSTALLCIDLVDRPNDEYEQLIDRIGRMVRLLYQEMFLNTFEEVWSF